MEIVDSPLALQSLADVFTRIQIADRNQQPILIYVQ
jgi:hypothetical protein